MSDKIDETIDMIKQLHKDTLFSCKIPPSKEPFKLKLETSNEKGEKKNEELIKRIIDVRANFRSRYLLNYFILPGKSKFSNKEFSNKSLYFDKLKKIYKDDDLNELNSLLIFITQYIKEGNEITFLNRDSSSISTYSFTVINHLLKNIGKRNRYISLQNGSNAVLKRDKYDIVIRSNITSLKDVFFISKEIGFKIDYLKLSNTTYMSLKDRVRIEEFYHKRLIYTFLLALLLQKQGGTLSLLVMTFEEKITQDILYLLSHFYKEVTIKNNNLALPISMGMEVICIGFKGVSKEELEDIFKIVKEGEGAGRITSILSNKYPKYICASQHIKYLKHNLESMIKLDKTIHSLSPSTFAQFNKKILKITFDYMERWYKKYYFSHITI